MAPLTQEPNWNEHPLQDEINKAPSISELLKKPLGQIQQQPTQAAEVAQAPQTRVPIASATNNDDVIYLGQQSKPQHHPASNRNSILGGVPMRRQGANQGATAIITGRKSRANATSRPGMGMYAPGNPPGHGPESVHAMQQRSAQTLVAPVVGPAEQPNVVADLGKKHLPISTSDNMAACISEIAPTTAFMSQHTSGQKEPVTEQTKRPANHGLAQDALSRIAGQTRQPVGQLPSQYASVHTAGQIRRAVSQREMPPPSRPSAIPSTRQYAPIMTGVPSQPSPPPSPPQTIAAQINAVFENQWRQLQQMSVASNSRQRNARAQEQIRLLQGGEGYFDHHLRITTTGETVRLTDDDRLKEGICQLQHNSTVLELHLPEGRGTAPGPVTVLPPQVSAAYRERMRQHLFYTASRSGINRSMLRQDSLDVAKQKIRLEQQKRTRYRVEWSDPACHFMTLSLEIRRMIYRLLLIPPLGGTFLCRETRVKAGTHIYPEILYTCRNIAREAIELLYTELRIMVSGADIYDLDSMNNSFAVLYGVSKVPSRNIWRFNPLNGTGFWARGWRMPVYNSPALGGHMYPHVFARFQHISFTVAYHNISSDGYTFTPFTGDLEKVFGSDEEKKSFAKFKQHTNIMSILHRILEKSTHIRVLVIDIPLKGPLREHIQLRQNLCAVVLKEMERTANAFIQQKIWLSMTEIRNVAIFRVKLHFTWSYRQSVNILPYQRRETNRWECIVADNYRKFKGIHTPMGLLPPAATLTQLSLKSTICPNKGCFECTKYKCRVPEEEEKEFARVSNRAVVARTKLFVGFLGGNVEPRPPSRIFPTPIATPTASAIRSHEFLLGQHLPTLP